MQVLVTKTVPAVIMAPRFSNLTDYEAVTSRTEERNYTEETARTTAAYCLLCGSQLLLTFAFVPLFFCVFSFFISEFLPFYLAFFLPLPLLFSLVSSFFVCLVLPF